MKKSDWIDVLNSLNQKDWTDWTIIVVSILSPILVLVSVIYTARAANAAKKAANINLQMYEEQKLDKERSYQPIFEVDGYGITEEYVVFNLINKNPNVISVTNWGSNREFKFEKSKDQTDTFKFCIFGEFKESDQLQVWLNLITLDRQKYKAHIVLRIVDTLVIEEQTLK